MTQLRSRRESLGLTQLEAACRIDAAQGAISFWETGQRMPTLAKFTDLADELGYEVTLTPKEDVRV